MGRRPDLKGCSGRDSRSESSATCVRAAGGDGGAADLACVSGAGAGLRWGTDSGLQHLCCI